MAAVSFRPYALAMSMAVLPLCAAHAVRPPAPSTARARARRQRTLSLASRSAPSRTSALDAKARSKRLKHKPAADRAGVAFVPLVASSLGMLQSDFREFLKLAHVRLDDDHLFRAFGGRRAFLARLVDSVSCAIARGTGYVARVALERLVFSVTGRHDDDLPEMHRLVAGRHGPPQSRARRRPAHDQERRAPPGRDGAGIGGALALRP